MKYFEVTFTLTPYSTDAADLLAALSAEAGFETFEDTPTGLKAYVQQSLFDRQALDSCIASFPFEATHIIYNIGEAEDRDWNEQWEQEGFEPIVISGKGLVSGERTNPNSRIIVIHDGRHLPQDISLSSQLSTLNSIEIDARQAFGTGTHETTRMICSMLLDMDLTGKRVLDCGCGTGILGICALKLGAAECIAYDIDEWSVDNTRHNAVINGVDANLTAMLGDATLLDDIRGRYALVMANINRNILLQDMERFVSTMEPAATLILSGFYDADCTLLLDKAKALGLHLVIKENDGEWACLMLQR